MIFFSSKKIAPVLYTSLFVWASLAGAAQAYGPEGLFGGRLNPDSTVVFDNPVQIDDRPLRAQTVLQHPRPDFDPVPYTLGSFEVFPSVEFGLSGDNNIYAAKSDAQGDMIFNARPSVSAFSNWNRHAVSMTTFADVNMYEKKDTENYNLFVTDMRGRYDVEAQTWIAAHAGYQYLASPRSSPDSVAGDEPGTFHVYKAGLSGYRGRGQIHVGLDQELTAYNYNDIKAAGVTLDQSSRDRTKNVVNARVVYDMTENLKPYIRGGYNWSLYQNTTNRDSEGYDVVVGATADFGGVTSGELFAGYMMQDYADFAFKPQNDAFKVGGRLEWNVTGLTSVVFEANRTIEETTSTNFNSYIATGGSATITHELLRNVLLEADTSFTHNDYNGNGSQKDDELGAGTGVRWLINRSLYSDLVYNWSHRYSTVPTSEYDRHVVSARLGVQM